MRYIKLIFIFLLNFILIQTTSFTKEVNKIVVKIDEELITNYDIKNKIMTTLILANKEINQKNINSLKVKSLEDLTLNRLKRIELSKHNIKKDNARLNSYLNSISSNNIQNLKILFEKNNVDFETFVDEVSVEIKWRTLIYKLFSKKIEINVEDIEQQIKKNSKNQNDLVKFNLSEIEIISSSDETDNQRISQVQNEIKNTSFESAIIKYSISTTANNKGKLGWINSNSLPKDFLNILSKMQIGEVSKPIKKQDKIIFLKLMDKKVSKFSTVDKENLKKELIKEKQNELFALYSSSFLSKLRNTKFIEYYE